MDTHHIEALGIIAVLVVSGASVPADSMQEQAAGPFGPRPTCPDSELHQPADCVAWNVDLGEERYAEEGAPSSAGRQAFDCSPSTPASVEGAASSCSGPGRRTRGTKCGVLAWDTT